MILGDLGTDINRLWWNNYLDNLGKVPNVIVWHFPFPAHDYLLYEAFSDMNFREGWYWMLGLELNFPIRR